MTLTLAAVLSLAVAQAAAGSFFRLEVGNPIAAGTDSKVKASKKIVLVVRPRECGDDAGVRVSATAEGIVNGQRQSLPLRLIALSTPGVHAVQREWPEGGQWVLHLTGTCPSPKATASTLVPVEGFSFVREKTQVLRNLATRAQVEGAVTQHARSGS